MTPASPLRPLALGRAEVSLATAMLLCAAAVTAGAAVLYGVDEAKPLMLVAGALGLVMAARQSLRAERDWFNPLLLLIATWVLRIAVPAVYLRFTEPPREFTTIFHLPHSQWDLGLALAIVGMAAIAFGWMALPRATATAGRSFAGALERAFRIDARTLVVAVVSMLLGLGAIVIFLRMNYSNSTEAITTGMIRKGGERVGGTSRYSFLASGLVTYGSVVAATYLLIVRRSRWPVGMLPAVAGTLVMSMFGGRVLALTPTVYAVLVLWYRSDRRHIRTPRVVLTGVLGALGFGLYSVFIAYYRNGFGLKAASVVLSMQGIGDYASKTLWYEAGMLHPYAVATYFPAGVLEGRSLPLTLGMGATLLGLDGVRPGQYMVEAVLGHTQIRVWGWHSGLIIDLYMNYGLLAVIVGGVLFGLLLRTVYAGFRAHAGGPVVTCFYVMLLWHFFWMYYEHTAAAMNIVLINFPFVILILAAARFLPERGRGSVRGLLRPPAPAPA